MIQPTGISAQPDPRGGRILVSWTNPVVAGFAGTRVLRRELFYPTVPADIGTSAEVYNDASTQAGQSGQFLDGGLKPERVYYYAVVSYDGAANTYPAYISAMSTAPYQTGQYLYNNLPGIYQSYDTALPPPSPALDPADLSKGQLRRFIEMFGLEFDVLRSYASGMKSFFDPAQVDGTLLPLLAGWIGWQTDYTLGLPKQRNQVRNAPHYYATTGIAANVRATINRVSTWDARIKEFTHNIFLSNIPEQFTIWEQERQGTSWQSEQLVTLDLAYEGRPSACQIPDGRLWLFYHARQSAPATVSGARITTARDRFQLSSKVFEQGAWLPARPLTPTAPIAGLSATNRCPAAVFSNDGTFWLFWSSLDDSGSSVAPRLRVQRFVAGRGALRARIAGTVAGPFPLADGDTFSITIGAAPGISRLVTFRAEDFADIAHATVEETAAVLDRELPGVDVSSAPDGTILITSQTAGSASVLNVPASTGAPKLGIATPPPGSNAVAAQILGTLSEPFALADSDTLLLTVDTDVPRLVTFAASSFLNIAVATASEVIAVINSVIPGMAQRQAGKIQLASAQAGANSLVSVDLGLSSAAPKLGLGQAPPPSPPGVDETEPSAFQDAAGNLWLFWSSRRDGTWKIWYNSLSAAGWDVPKPLTTGALPDREASALFDASAGGRIWVFWSRKKANGLWNVFSRTTATLDFNTQTQASWTEAEFTPAPANYDNREPAATLVSSGNLEVFFSSNQTNGWNVWSRTVTVAAQGVDSAATAGQYTRRGPVPLEIAPGRLHLWFRNNEVMEYTSKVYASARTIDGRYTGSTTADTRNPARLSLRGDILDIQHYTYETPLADPLEEAARLYSMDTIGVYLTPDTNDQELILSGRTQIGNVLTNFLPIQTRVVFLIDQSYTEYIYSYDAPAGTPTETIGDRMIDTLISEVAAPAVDSFADTVNFHFLRTWASGLNTGTTPDTAVVPPDLSFRLLLAHVNEEP